MDECFQDYLTHNKDSKLELVRKLLMGFPEEPPRFFTLNSSEPIPLKVLPIPTFTVPVGRSCYNCQKLLQPPYYYGVGSKLHRCVECTEKTNSNPESLMKLYTVNENSVLVMSNDHRNVDLKRIGKNIQPKSLDECLPYEYTCNGCG